MAESPDPIDVHVGKRVRLRRNLLGMSQEKLAKEVGLTFQQIQKYEKGANRIGASRLYQFSRILNVPVSFFFEDVPPEVSDNYKTTGTGMSDVPQAAFQTANRLAEKETLDLVEAYYRITRDGARRKVLDLMRELSHD